VLTTRYQDALDRSFRPIGRWLGRLGVTPAMLTLASPLLLSLVCLWFYRTRNVLLFALAIVALGMLDALDGAVARATGRVSRFGAYLDAVCDRYFEVIAVFTVAAVTGYWALSMTALSGSLLISYAKARAAMETAVSNKQWPDLMERAERSAVFVAGMLAGAYLPWYPGGRDLFWWTLLILSVLNHATVVQRALRARALIGAK
jgi:phosphatidylglycerophosphate synthase